MGLAPRVGYAFRLSDRLVLWPRAGLGYSLSYAPCPEGLTCEDTTFETWDMNAAAPIVVEVVPHLFVGLGPWLAHTPAQNHAPSFTSYGLRSVFGGWF